MTVASPDPVAAPSEYQRLMLSLLGQDDPASVQEETPGAVRAMIATASADLRRRPAEGEWSVLELVGHLADAELVMAGRYRWVLAHDEPPITGYDQDRWVDRLRHNEDDPHDLLALFEALRRANLALWRGTPAPARRRVGIHSERGPESLDLMFRMLAGHDRFHLAQMDRTLAAIRAGVRSAQ
jgi:DinB family protein